MKKIYGYYERLEDYETAVLLVRGFGTVYLNSKLLPKSVKAGDRFKMVIDCEKIK